MTCAKEGAPAWLAALDGIIADQRTKALAERAVLERGGPGWAASDPERDDEFAPVGFGPTREAALADLIERCADEDDAAPVTLRIVHCPECNGEGVFERGHPNAPYPSSTWECGNCDGTGEVEEAVVEGLQREIDTDEADWIAPGGWEDDDGQPDEAQEWADYDLDC